MTARATAPKDVDVDPVDVVDEVEDDGDFEAFELAPKDPERKPVAKFKIGDVRFSLFEPPDSAKLMSINVITRFHTAASADAKWRSTAALIDFLGACMDQGDHNRLYETLVSPRLGMSDAELFRLCTWAIEKTVGLPTVRSTGSPAGRSTAGRKSTAGSRSRARATPRR